MQLLWAVSKVKIWLEEAAGIDGKKMGFLFSCSIGVVMLGPTSDLIQNFHFTIVASQMSQGKFMSRAQRHYPSPEVTLQHALVLNRL